MIFFLFFPILSSKSWRRKPAAVTVSLLPTCCHGGSTSSCCFSLNLASWWCSTSSSGRCAAGSLSQTEISTFVHLFSLLCRTPHGQGSARRAPVIPIAWSQARPSNAPGWRPRAEPPRRAWPWCRPTLPVHTAHAVAHKERRMEKEKMKEETERSPPGGVQCALIKIDFYRVKS